MDVESKAKNLSGEDLYNFVDAIFNLDEIRDAIDDCQSKTKKDPEHIIITMPPSFLYGIPIIWKNQE